MGFQVHWFPGNTQPFGHSSAHLVIKRGETTNCGRTSTKPSTNPPKNCSALVIIPSYLHVHQHFPTTLSLSWKWHIVPNWQTPWSTHGRLQLWHGISISVNMSRLSRHWHVTGTQPQNATFLSRWWSTSQKLRYPISRHIHIFTSQGGAAQVMFVGL